VSTFVVITAQLRMTLASGARGGEGAGSVAAVLAWIRAVVDRVNTTDRALTRRIGALPRTRADDGLRRLTSAADHSKLWLVLIVLLASRRGVTRRAAFRGAAAIAGASLLANAAAKPLFPRRRPAADALPNWRSLPDPPTSSSFPSGHAASAAALTTALAMESPLAGVLVAPLAATVAYSRVHTGVHWPSDVAAGAALGVGVALATRRWWPVRPGSPATARPHADADSLVDGQGLVIACNPLSGDPQADPVGEIAAALPAARMVIPEDATLLAEELEAAIDRDTVAIGVAGGDGSVCSIAAVAAQRRLPFVVLPTGTLNHFARDVGVRSVQDAADAVAKGEAVAVDLATVAVNRGKPRPFLNTASLGGYPDMVRLREKWQDRWGKWPAAAMALVRVLAAASPMRVRIDGRPRRVWILFVGNGPYHPRGMAPAYRPSLETGLLDVRYLRADLPLSRLRFVLGAVTGALLHSRTYVQREAHSVRVDVLGQPVALATDGEVVQTGSRFEFTATRRPLAVYRPES
jgi:diacylglycerol kinase family enzyme/membrane-associated phospholipid phosphatase